MQHGWTTPERVHLMSSSVLSVLQNIRKGTLLFPWVEFVCTNYWI